MGPKRFIKRIYKRAEAHYTVELTKFSRLCEIDERNHALGPFMESNTPPLRLFYLNMFFSDW